MKDVLTDFFPKEIMKEYPKEKQEQILKSWQQVCKKVEIADVTGPARSWPVKYEETPKYPVGLWPPTKEQLKELAEKLVQVALVLGAADAKVVSTKNIPQDIRALHIGCLYPSCRWLNTNMFCPLKATFEFEDMEELVKENYSTALVFKTLPPEFDGSIPDVGDIDLDSYYNLGGQPDPDKAMLARNIVRLRILDEISFRLRQAAWYSGCLICLDLGKGPCLVTKCADKKVCPALRPTGVCPFRSRVVNAQVMFIDYHQLGKDLGWGQLQIGGNCAFPEEVPDPENYYNMGIVLLD